MSAYRSVTGYTVKALSRICDTRQVFASTEELVACLINFGLLVRQDLFYSGGTLLAFHMCEVDQLVVGRYELHWAYACSQLINNCTTPLWAAAIRYRN